MKTQQLQAGRHALQAAMFVVALALVLATSGPVAVAQACYASSIVSPTPFKGNNGEVIRLLDGSLWEVKYEYQYLYEYRPNVVVCPGHGRLIVAGRSLNVEQLAAPRPSQQRGRPSSSDSASVIETHIDGEFEGWDGDTVFKMMNGQIWQQASYAYTYFYAYSPKVVIFRTSRGYEMAVEGVPDRIPVERLR